MRNKSQFIRKIRKEQKAALKSDKAFRKALETFEMDHQVDGQIDRHLGGYLRTGFRDIEDLQGNEPEHARVFYPVYVGMDLANALIEATKDTPFDVRQLGDSGSLERGLYGLGQKIDADLSSVQRKELTDYVARILVDQVIKNKASCPLEDVVAHSDAALIYEHPYRQIIVTALYQLLHSPTLSEAEGRALRGFIGGDKSRRTTNDALILALDELENGRSLDDLDLSHYVVPSSGAEVSAENENANHLEAPETMESAESSYSDQESAPSVDSELDSIVSQPPTALEFGAPGEPIVAHFSVEEMADQLYALNQAVIMAISDRGILDHRSDDASVQLATQSEKKLVLLIQNDIFSASTERSVISRAQYWLKVADLAIRQGDFVSADAIHKAINHVSLDRVKNSEGQKVLSAPAITEMPEYQNLQVLYDYSGNNIVLRAAMTHDQAYFDSAVDGSMVEKAIQRGDPQERAEKKAQAIGQLASILPDATSQVLPNVSVACRDIEGYSATASELRKKLKTVLDTIQLIQKGEVDPQGEKQQEASVILADLAKSMTQDGLNAETPNPEGFLPRLIEDLREHLAGKPLELGTGEANVVSQADLDAYNQCVADSPYRSVQGEAGHDLVVDPPTLSAFLAERIARVMPDQLAKMAYFFDNKKQVQHQYQEAHPSATMQGSVLQVDALPAIAQTLQRFEGVDENQPYDVAKKLSARITDPTKTVVIDRYVAQDQATQMVNRIHDLLNPKNPALHERLEKACAIQDVRSRKHQIARLLTIRQESTQLRRDLTLAGAAERASIAHRAKEAYYRLQLVESALAKMPLDERVTEIQSAIMHEKAKFKRIAVDAMSKDLSGAARRVTSGTKAQGKQIVSWAKAHLPTSKSSSTKAPLTLFWQKKKAEPEKESSSLKERITNIFKKH